MPSVTNFAVAAFAGLAAAAPKNVARDVAECFPSSSGSPSDSGALKNALSAACVATSETDAVGNVVKSNGGASIIYEYNQACGTLPAYLDPFTCGNLGLQLSEQCGAGATTNGGMISNSCWSLVVNTNGSPSARSVEARDTSVTCYDGATTSRDALQSAYLSFCGGAGDDISAGTTKGSAGGIDFTIDSSISNSIFGLSCEGFFAAIAETCPTHGGEATISSGDFEVTVKAQPN